MAVLPQRHLFSWREVTAASDLDRLRLVLSVIPDEPLVRKLEKHRGHGRNDYPIRPTWNAVLAGVVFQHPSAASLLRELRRNAELRQMLGFNPLWGAASVPSDDAFGRFLELLMEYEEELTAMFHHLVRDLAEELPDFGKRLAIDSKAIKSAGKPIRGNNRERGPDRRRDPDADWGVKSYKGQRKDGSTWEKVIRWFGYKLHLLADSVYELPLAFEVTAASANDCPHLMPLLEQHQEAHPQMRDRAKELTGDKGYDSIENHSGPYEKMGIRTIIDTKKLWKEGEDETRPVFPDRVEPFVYDESGEVFCICPATGTQREMAFVGFEKKRRALKYRCPAAAYRLQCDGRAECEKNANVSQFGRTIRIPLSLNRRIFTPTARSSYAWQRAYNRRSAVERFNSRVHQVLGFERHTIRGLAKMTTQLSIGLIVVLAMALGRIRANQAHLMRSLTAPVARAA